jgi:hypothetical protein
VGAELPLPLLVVWQGFGKISQTFAYFQHADQLKLLAQPLGTMYRVGALITNIHTLIDGGGTTEAYFQCQAPFDVEWYLAV